MSLPSSDDKHAASNATNNDTAPNNTTINDDDRDDLARRLSALRAPASTSAPAIPQDDSQGDKALEARFRRLFLRQPPQPDPSTLTAKDAAVSDEQVSSFIASVQNEREQQPTGTRQIDEGEIEALLAEASRIAVFGREHSYDEDVDWADGDWDGDWDSGGGGGGGGVPEWLREAAHEQAQHEEEAEVLQIARDEVEFERRHAPALHSPCREDRAREDPADKGPPEEQDDIAALERRLNALGGAAVGAAGRGGGGQGGEGGGLQLPSAPKAIPGVAAKKGDGAGVSEVDTWCCLFPHRCHLLHHHHHHRRRRDVGSPDRHLQRGRRIHVFGLRRRHLLQRVSARRYLEHPLFPGQQLIGSYCTAHTGPDAGYEERRHKWTRYIRPNKVLSAA